MVYLKKKNIYKGKLNVEMLADGARLLLGLLAGAGSTGTTQRREQRDVPRSEAGMTMGVGLAGLRRVRLLRERAIGSGSMEHVRSSALLRGTV